MLRSAPMSRVAWRLLLISTLLAGLPSDRPALGDGALPARISRAEQAFIQQHWRRPLLPQGEAPEHFSSVERSLAPAACGTCHPVQFADWRASLHSRSKGPGIAGQLAE